jgi:hypothetical protein
MFPQFGEFLSLLLRTPTHPHTIAGVNVTPARSPRSGSQSTKPKHEAQHEAQDQPHKARKVVTMVDRLVVVGERLGYSVQGSDSGLTVWGSGFTSAAALSSSERLFTVSLSFL